MTITFTADNNRLSSSARRAAAKEIRAPSTTSPQSQAFGPPAIFGFNPAIRGASLQSSSFTDDEMTKEASASALDYWVDIASGNGLVNASRETSPFDFPGNDGFCDIFGDLGSLPEGLEEGFNLPVVQGDPARPGDYPGASARGVPTPATLGSQRPPSLPVSADRSSDEPTEQLASRLGKLRIAEDDHLRYYGATSNLHLIRNGLVPCFQPTIRTVPTHGEEALKRAGLEWKPDPIYEKHLTNFFFAWHNTFQFIVHEAVYYDHRDRYKSGLPAAYYSPTLENAIFATGATYDTQKHPEMDEDPSEFFGHRAKVLLEIEMDSPTLATVQALLVLAAHEATRVRDTRGWIYVGMASQLLSDFGLHLDLDVTSHPARRALEMDNDVNLRRSLYWATQCMDILYSAFTGRPASTRYDDYNVPIPEPFPKVPWKPYIDCASPVPDLPSGLKTATVGSTHVYLAHLCTKIRRITATLYTHPESYSASVETFVQNMTRELQHWQASLPRDLGIDMASAKNRAYLPSVIMLHCDDEEVPDDFFHNSMQFYETMIFLHRPFLSSPWLDQSNSRENNKSEDSGKICEDSATMICALVSMYRQQWNLRRIHAQAVAIILAAGLIHTHNCCIYSSQKGVDARKQLSICVQALGEMSHFNLSTRALEILISLRRDWQMWISRKPGKRMGRES